MTLLRTLRLQGLSVALLAGLSLFFVGCGDNGYDGPLDGDETGGSTVVNKNANVATTDKAVLRLEFPALKKTGNQQVIIERLSSTGNTTTVAGKKTKFDSDGINFAVEWDCDKKSQRWTCYQLHSGFTGSYSRVADFAFDPALSSQYYWSDYKSFPGYDRGHICPSADRTFSREANTQTFYMSNMQPQYHNFNSGIWLRMEQMLQSWAKNLSTTDTLYVCKGGTIDSEKNILTRIDKKIIVPKYFYMAILRKSAFGYAAMAFWIDQKRENDSSTLLSHAISIDKLEELTGIDFFCNLPDNIEDSVEKTFNASSWNGLR